MNFPDLLHAIDVEIARLTEARALIAATVRPQKRRGRPPGKTTKQEPSAKKRTLSASARKKIAEAQRKRWAKQRQPAKAVDVTKVPAKKQRERKARAAKKAPQSNALSNRNETVAAAPKA